MERRFHLRKLELLVQPVRIKDYVVQVSVDWKQTSKKYENIYSTYFGGEKSRSLSKIQANFKKDQIQLYIRFFDVHLVDDESQFARIDAPNSGGHISIIFRQKIHTEPNGMN